MSEVFGKAKHEVFRQFDQVRIVDPAGITWLFTPQADLGGTWTVVSLVVAQRLLIIARGGALIRIPLTGVQKAATYSLEAIETQLKESSGYGQG